MKKGANICNEGMVLAAKKGNMVLIYKNCAEMQTIAFLA